MVRVGSRPDLQPAVNHNVKPTLVLEAVAVCETADIAHMSLDRGGLQFLIMTVEVVP